MFAGTAKLYPSYEPERVLIAVLIPINCPDVLIKAPPLFPGFTAASVWINASIADLSSIIFIFLPFAEIMPAVTVDVRLNGFPTARTHSPSFRSSEFPKVKSGRFFTSIFKTARSVVGSVPIISAGYSLLSFKLTFTSLAFSTT